jgi:hypothetical protein
VAASRREHDRPDRGGVNWLLTAAQAAKKATVAPAPKSAVDWTHASSSAVSVPQRGPCRYSRRKIALELEPRIAARWEEYGIGIPYLDDERRELLTMEHLSKRLSEV